MQIGILYIVATPIGNLGDITKRAVFTLREVDIILCEDTRVTKKLLNNFDIKTSTMSYHQHSGDKKINDIKILLEKGKNLALVTDAGTPGISDPGNRLVEHLARIMKHLKIKPVPGVSAVITALSISGFSTDRFLFLGFPPHKNKRKKFFEEVASAKYTVVFYESCHRIKKTIDQMTELLGEDRKICICRELTKKFESVYRGSFDDILKLKIPEKGEFVICVRSR